VSGTPTNQTCAAQESLESAVSEITAVIRTNGHGLMDSAGDPDQEYTNFMELETLPFTCYILFDESSIPFSSTSNVYYGLKYFGLNNHVDTAIQLYNTECKKLQRKLIPNSVNWLMSPRSPLC